MTTGPTTHLREWDLKRLAAGELDSAQEAALRAHLEGCEACRATERTLAQSEADARRELEAALPFEQFAQGVERLLKTAPRRRALLGGRWVQGGWALAACVTVAVVAPRLVGGGLLRHDHGGSGRSDAPLGERHLGNRLKGGAQVELRIAGAGDGPQRVAVERGAEPLGPGERVRIGYRAGTHRYVAAISVDAQGEVSALYPEAGSSLPATPSAQLTYLPGSLEFTGRGSKKVIVVLSDAPLAVTQLTQAAQAAFRQAGGDVSRLPPLALPGEQFQRTLLEP